MWSPAYWSPTYWSATYWPPGISAGISLEINGVAVLPSGTIDVGAIAIGGTYTLTIKNLGVSPLNVGSIQYDFEAEYFSGFASGEILGGAEATTVVRIPVTATSPFSGEIIVGSDDSENPNYMITVTGVVAVSLGAGGLAGTLPHTGTVTVKGGVHQSQDGCCLTI